MTFHETVHLTVIVVSYNVRDLLQSALESIERSAALSADRLVVDIIVVDNASADDSASMVDAMFPTVQLIASEENLGFTGGNNAALRRLGIIDADDNDVPALLAAPDFVLLLNPDAEIVDDALWQMVASLLDNPQAGACGAHLFYGDGTFQHGAFTFPTLTQILIDFFPLTGAPGIHRLHNGRLNGRYPQARWAMDEPFSVDFVLGAAMMVRSSAIEDVGGLDDDYFMYCEEMDWAMRLHQAGWDLLAVPTAHVIHHEGQSSRQVRWEAFVRLWQSRYLFYSKHAGYYPKGYLAAVRLAVRAALWMRCMQARRYFREGTVDGRALARELDAYRTVMAL